MRHLHTSIVTAGSRGRRLLCLLVLCFAVGASTAQSERTYTVRPGDTLYRIAINHNLTVELLQSINGIEGTVIKVGQVLNVTPVGGAVASDSTGLPLVPPAVVPIPPPADSLTTPSTATETDPVDEAGSDSLSVEGTGDGDPVTAGDGDSGLPADDNSGSQTVETVEPSPPILEVSPPPAQPVVNAAPRSRFVRAVRDSTGSITHGEYSISAGQSFFEVAFVLGVPVDTLAALNEGFPIVLSDGDGTVKVPARFASSTYTVKAGDTLYRIASEHGLSSGQLVLANPGASEMIRIGQTLEIPAGVTSVEASLPLPIAEGPASVYPARFEGRLMASGVPYDASRHTLSHPALPFGTVVMIENVTSGKTTFAEVADRMPVSTDFVVEVSQAVADAIVLGNGVVRVRIIHSRP